jgi:hypothetical protein
VTGVDGPFELCHCSRCRKVSGSAFAAGLYVGSSLPEPEAQSPLVEIPAGTLDDDPQLKPDKHIYVDVKSSWFEIADDLPQFDRVEIRRHRGKQRWLASSE